MYDVLKPLITLILKIKRYSYEKKSSVTTYFLDADYKSIMLIFFVAGKVSFIVMQTYFLHIYITLWGHGRAVSCKLLNKKISTK